MASSYVLSWLGGYWFVDEPTFHQAEVIGFMHQQLPVVRAQETLRHHVVDKRDQAVIEAVDIQQADRLVVKTELRPGQYFK